MPSYDEWLAANGWQHKKPELAKFWGLKEGKNPLEKLARVFKESGGKFTKILKKMKMDKVAQATFCAAVQALPEPPPCEGARVGLDPGAFEGADPNLRVTVQEKSLCYQPTTLAGRV